MNINQSLIPEFDNEMAIARKILERVPESALDWQPHDKSMTIRALVTHVANIPAWGAMTIQQDAFDTAPVGEKPFTVDPISSVGNAVEVFDKNVADARAALVDASDETLMGTWRLLAGGEERMAMPRVAVLRSFVMNHLIHHRAQLGVFLRLKDVPVPSTYGPSADETS